MKRFIAFAFLLFLVPVLTAYADISLTLYPMQKNAQQHCPNDEVVWLNTKTGIWHAQGARWYGATKQGAYVCKKEAAAAGDRGSLNG